GLIGRPTEQDLIEGIDPQAIGAAGVDVKLLRGDEAGLHLLIRQSVLELAGPEGKSVRVCRTAEELQVGRLDDVRLEILGRVRQLQGDDKTGLAIIEPPAPIGQAGHVWLAQQQSLVDLYDIALVQADGRRFRVGKRDGGHTSTGNRPRAGPGSVNRALAEVEELVARRSRCRGAAVYVDGRVGRRSHEEEIVASLAIEV